MATMPKDFFFCCSQRFFKSYIAVDRLHHEGTWNSTKSGAGAQNLSKFHIESEVQKVNRFKNKLWLMHMTTGSCILLPSNSVLHQSEENRAEVRESSNFLFFSLWATLKDFCQQLLQNTPFALK